MARANAAEAVDATETVLSTLGLALWWLLRRPWVLLPCAMLVGLFVTGGWRLAGTAIAAMIVALGAWRLLAPNSFAIVVSGPWRRAAAKRRYRRHWPAVADLCGLVKRRAQPITPHLRRIEVGAVADRLKIEMAAGQSALDYERVCPELADSLGALSARVWFDRPGVVWLELVHSDALVDVVPARSIPEVSQLERVPVGIREDGSPWFLPLLGTHLFIAGVTGSGKGSVIWSLLRGVARDIRRGLVEVWGVDPKGGMELGFGRPMFTRFAAESTVAMVELLEAAVTVMDARCRDLAGITRLHSPTAEAPLLLVVVDELSTLTAYEPDTKLRVRATAAVSALLARGRAAAVVVVAAAQDPRKEVVGFRSQFPTKVALRLESPVQVDMVLGDGMHAMGGAADRISASCPGVGYVTVEGIREPMRVRAAYLTDDDIAEMARDYPAPARDDTPHDRTFVGIVQLVESGEL